MNHSWFPVKDKTYIILGLARSGLSTAKWLERYGAQVYGWDDSSEKRASALELGIPLLPIDSLDDDMDWSQITALVQSPGIPFNFPKPHALTAKAQANSIPIISDCDLFRAAHRDIPIVGITGTNGKSTTTALITHIFNECKINAHMGGNIGKACFDLPIIKPGENGLYVLELSSFQLELSQPLNLTVPVFINIGVDHLDRHGSMEDYVKAKAKIFNHDDNSSPHAIVIGVDDAYSKGIFEHLTSTQNNDDCPIIAVSTKTILQNGIYINGDYLIDNRFNEEKKVLNFKDTKTLNPAHNRQNAAIAYGVAVGMGLKSQQVAQAIESFPGLEHRQEVVGKIGNITFVNDSKATNAMSTQTAFENFENIYWIAGGVPKTDGIESLIPYFGKIKQAFLIGKARFKFAATIQGLIVYSMSETLDQALSQAFREASLCKGPAVILLSPACASFDQFKDFEDRGRVFKQLVEQLCAKHTKKVKNCA